jgi:hypothetical protein
MCGSFGIRVTLPKGSKAISTGYWSKDEVMESRKRSSAPLLMRYLKRVNFHVHRVLKLQLEHHLLDATNTETTTCLISNHLNTPLNHGSSQAELG